MRICGFLLLFFLFVQHNLKFMRGMLYHLIYRAKGEVFLISLYGVKIRVHYMQMRLKYNCRLQINILCKVLCEILYLKIVKGRCGILRTKTKFF
jgi:hypothetical protein